MKQYTITISFSDPAALPATDEELIEEITDVLENIGLDDIDITFPRCRE